MRRKDAIRRKKRISNRKLSEKYYYVGEEKTVTGLRLTQYDAHSLTSKTIDPSGTSFKKLINPSHINWLTDQPEPHQLAGGQRTDQR